MDKYNYLNETQKDFLGAFCQRRGDVFAALDDIGMEFVHFKNWRNDQIFEEIYQEFRKDIFQFLKEDNYLKALGKLNTIFTVGYVVSEEIKHSVHEDPKTGKDCKRVSRKKTISEIPPNLYNLAINDTNIEKALATLLNEGIITSDISKRILATIEKNRNDLTEVFRHDTDTDLIKPKDTIALIKSAVLGNDDQLIN